MDTDFSGKVWRFQGLWRSAGFQTCCVADFQIGEVGGDEAQWLGGRHAGLETRDTADLEVRATLVAA